jgi:hypothetical protein
MRFDDLGRMRGACSLKCHGENHEFRTYP